jgi:hypothetical protein
MCFVKIHYKKKAYFILKPRIDAHDKIPTVVILARQMQANYFIGDWNEAAELAFGAF